MSSSMFKNGFNCRLKGTQSLIPRSLSLSENLLKGWRPYKEKASGVYCKTPEAFLNLTDLGDLVGFAINYCITNLLTTTFSAVSILRMYIPACKS
jgi:hypothetical protein